MNIHIIVTGATFDKEYNELNGEKQIPINNRMKTTKIIVGVMLVARLTLSLATALVALFATPSANAATYYWDTNAAAGFGAVGPFTWDGVNNFWNTDITGATSGTFIASPTNADDLFINGGTTGTITLSGAQIASSLTFANNVAKTLSGGTSLTIGGTGTRSGIFVNAGDNSANTISSLLILNSTSTALNFTNAGTGLLTIGAVTGSAASGTQTITAGASNLGGITLGGIIGNGAGGGNVALTINSSGVGITRLNAANTYTGATTVSAGVLNIQNATALGTTAAGTTVASGATLQIQNNITVGAEALTLNGNGYNNNGALRNISGNNNYGGLVTLGSSTIINSDTAATTLTLSNAGTITGTGFDLTAGGAGNITINSNIGTTTGGLTKVGSGTVTLTGTNTYTGNTLAQSGMLQVTNQVSLYNNGVAAAWSNTNIVVERGATMAFNVGGAGQFTEANINALLALSNSTTNGFTSGSILGLDTGGLYTLFDSVIANTNGGANVLGLNKLGTGTLTLSQNNTYTGHTVISGGILELGDFDGVTGSLSSTSTILNNGTLSIYRSNAVVQGTDFSAAPIVGTGAFVQYGTGTTTLNAANTFSGTTTLNDGVLNLTHSLALQNSALITNVGLGTLTLTGPTTLTLGGLSGATGNLASIITSGYTGTITALTLNPLSGSVTYGGVIANGAMSLTKTGAGTQILSGANTYTGATIVNAGTLTVGSGATGSLDSTSTLQMGGGIFNYSRTGAGQTVNGLTVNAGNSTVNNTSSGQTLTLGAITRTASAFGTVNFATLTGAINTSTINTNSIIGPWATTGSTTTLRYAVGGGNITGLTGTTATAADLSNVTDATVNYEYSAAATTVGNLTGNTLRYSGGNTTTTIGASNTLTLNGLMNAGSASTLLISGGPTTGGIIIGSTNELVIAANAQATTISARIADGASAGRLVYSGGGTLTLQGINLYTGGTTINAGIVALTSTATVSPTLGTGPVTVNNGGRLSLIAGFGSQAVTVTNALTLNGGTLALGGGNSAATYSGTINLTGNNTVDGGNSNFETNTISGAISGAGGFTKTGAGPIRLTGANTYTGPTVISNGALIFKSSLYGNDTSKWTPANITVASNAVLALSVGGAGEFTMAQAATMFTNLTTNVNNNGLLANSFMSVDTRNASGTNTFTYSSILTDSTGPGGGAVNFKFYGTGTNTLELSGANTYSGLTLIDNNGTLRVSSFNSVFTNVGLGTVHSASSSLGAPTTVASGTIWLGAGGYNGNSHPGATYQGGRLVYTGTGETTDRVLNLAGNATYILDHSGSGLLKFTSQPNVLFQGGTVVLQGSTSGSGEIPSANTNGQALAYTKNGTGTWALSGVNLYTGATTINGGTLMIKGANNLLGTVTVNTGGNFSLADGTARATTGAATGTGLTLATGSTMAFDWNAGSLDSFTTTGTATSAGNVGIIINNTSPSGSGATLITAASGSTLSTANYFLANNTNFTASLSKTATTVSIGAQTVATALTNAYWKRNQVTGALDTMAYSLGTLSNWASDAAGTSANGVVPGGSAVNLIFGTTGSVPGSPTLGADMNLGSITFNDTAAVTISGSNAITLNSTSGTAATTTAALATVTAGSAISVTSFANATNTISAKLVLGANQTWNIASGKTLAVSGVVSGTYSLTKADAGTLTLSGANIYTGATTVSAGTLKAGVASVAGVSGAFGYNSAITLANTAGVTMDITGFNTQIGSLTGGGTTGGNVTLGAATLTVGGDHTSPAAYAGIISSTGAGALTKIGNGTQILSGANTYTGVTNVNAGKLLVNGSISSSSLTTVASGATVGGSGTIGALTVSSGGFINPGNSPDTLDLIGAYTQAGTYNAEITANTVGNGTTGYDQISVTGAVNITGGSLNAMFTAGLYTNGDLIFILLNDMTDGITGTYAGLAQGATVTSYGGFDWTISYTADSVGNTFTLGNDIALMAIPEPSTALLGCLGVLLLLRRRRN